MEVQYWLATGAAKRVLNNPAVEVLFGGSGGSSKQAEPNQTQSLNMVGGASVCHGWNKLPVARGMLASLERKTLGGRRRQTRSADADLEAHRRYAEATRANQEHAGNRSEASSVDALPMPSFGGLGAQGYSDQFSTSRISDSPQLLPLSLEGPPAEEPLNSEAQAQDRTVPFWQFGLPVGSDLSSAFRLVWNQLDNWFLQEAIPEDNKTVSFFQAICPEMVGVAGDVFGNSVIQKLFARGIAEQKKAAALKLQAQMSSPSIQFSQISVFIDGGTVWMTIFSSTQIR